MNFHRERRGIDPIRGRGAREGGGKEREEKFVELLGVSGVTGERYRRLRGRRPASSQRERGPGVSIGRWIVCEIPSIVFDESIEARRPRSRNSRYAGAAPGSLAAFFAANLGNPPNETVLNRPRDNYNSSMYLATYATLSLARDSDISA